MQIVVDNLHEMSNPGKNKKKNYQLVVWWICPGKGLALYIFESLLELIWILFCYSFTNQVNG